MSGVSAKDFGALYLPAIGFLSFHDLEFARPAGSYYVVFLPPRVFHDLWKLRTNEDAYGPPPGAISTWPAQQRKDFIWQFTKGPRQPVALPYILFNGERIDVLSSKGVAQAFLDWDAAKIPALIPQKDLYRLIEQTAQDADFIADHEYLASNRSVLTAFQERQSLAELYRQDYRQGKQTKETIIDGARVYASLIHFQLETMILRISICQGSNLPELQKRYQKGLCEMRRLLHQRHCVMSWLGDLSDPDALPDWQRHDGVSEETALHFLAENRKKNHRRGSIMRLQLVPDDESGDLKVTAPRSIKPNPTAFKVIASEPSLPVDQPKTDRPEQLLLAGPENSGDTGAALGPHIRLAWLNTNVPEIGKARRPNRKTDHLSLLSTTLG